jgi:Domain of unknown function (DUF4279)
LKKPIPQPASDVPEGTLWFGGPIPWFSISLTVSADDLDPDEITRLLGVQPDRAQRKGVPLPRHDGSPGRVPTFGAWSIRLLREETTEWDVEEAIALVLDRVAVNDEVWRQAVSNTNVRIFIGLTLDTFNRGFGFAPALLKRIGDLGIQLDFDVYAEESAHDASATDPDK